MQYLIDGYNLLHALGALRGRVDLETARLRLLGVLHRAYGPESSDVTVVFDAGRRPAGVPSELTHRGIRVVFAVEQDEADDLLELLIRKAPAPKKLTVVSDDHRVQRAARRRHCVVRGCAEYLEWLDRRRRPVTPRLPAPPAKPEGVSDAEARRWLDEFAGLADDPDLKELFDPFRLLDDEPPGDPRR